MADSGVFAPTFLNDEFLINIRMKQTLLISALLCLSTMAVSAQHKVEQKAVNTVARLLTGQGLNHAAKANAAGTKQLPKHSITYDYDGMNNKYMYDTDYTYNATGTVATETWHEGDNLIDFVTNTYDPVFTEFLTLTTETSYDDETQTWADPQTTYRFDITRNADGQIIQMVDFDCDGSDGPEADATISISYGSDGLPTTMTITQSNDLTNEVEITLSDLEWTEASGQQMAEMGDLIALISGGKQLKSGTMSLTIMGLPLSGPLTVSYDESGNITANAELGYLGSPFLTYSIMQTIADEYGSYQLDVAVNGMNMNQYSRTTVTLDEYGNTLLEEEFEGETADDLEQQSGDKYEYTYRDYNGTIHTIIQYDWNSGEDTYSPNIKTVYEDFVSGIESVTEAISGASNRVYSANGVVVGQSTENLPSGLYIVREGNTTRKVMKR